jgi:hypothetical protein
MPHKEERFLFVGYPLLALTAAWGLEAGFVRFFFFFSIDFLPLLFFQQFFDQFFHRPVFVNLLRLMVKVGFFVVVAGAGFSDHHFLLDANQFV